MFHSPHCCIYSGNTLQIFGSKSPCTAVDAGSQIVNEIETGIHLYVEACFLHIARLEASVHFYVDASSQM